MWWTVVEIATVLIVKTILVSDSEAAIFIQPLTSIQMETRRKENWSMEFKSGLSHYDILIKYLEAFM